MSIKSFISNIDSLEKKLFWIISINVFLVAFITTIANIIQHMSPIAVGVTGLACVLTIVCDLFCIKKQNYTLYYFLICLIINCLIFPIDYFVCGGLKSGFPMYIINGLLICAFCYNRKYRIISLIVSVLAFLIELQVGHFFPEFILVLDEKTFISDIFSSLIIVSISIVFICILVIHEYKKQRSKEINNNLIDILGTAVELRSTESGEHVKRIKGYTNILLKYVSEVYPERKYTREEINIITAASALHDVGKIAIPDAILLKPAELTAEEYEIMKTHCVRGCELLKDMKDIQDNRYFNYCYDICRHHHERFDGNGYPDKLKGDEISLEAQIVSVADVYDALISKRCYKDPYDCETAFKMILNGECGIFSPKILECMKLAKKDMEQFAASSIH